MRFGNITRAIERINSNTSRDVVLRITPKKEYLVILMSDLIGYVPTKLSSRLVDQLIDQSIDLDIIFWSLKMKSDGGVLSGEEPDDELSIRDLIRRSKVRNYPSKSDISVIQSIIEITSLMHQNQPNFKY